MALPLKQLAKDQGNDIVGGISRWNTQNIEAPSIFILPWGVLERILTSFCIRGRFYRVVPQFFDKFPRLLINEILGVFIKFIAMPILLGQTQRRYYG